MKKQFASKQELIDWTDKNFPEEPMEWTFENVAKSGKSFTEEEIAAIERKLIEEGYDLDDLTANGEAYQIGGHTNNDWNCADKEE